MKKTEEMKRYERETGKNAIWNGKITKDFKKWKAGKKIYHRNKERVSLYVSNNMKHEWEEFIKNHDDIPGYSKLIRESVTDYINKRLKTKDNNLLEKIYVNFLLFFL